MQAGKTYIGVDVQSARGCPFAVLNADARMIRNGWLQDAAGLRQLVTLLAAEGAVVVGIDAPRMPVTAPRQWASERGRWVRKSVERGRHCEVVVRSLGLANPQWTPLAKDAEPWMQLGFAMFRSLAGLPHVVVHEVFPSASYRMFEVGQAPSVTLSLTSFEPGPKDMLDAIVAAVTIREFTEGRGSEIGGGDGMGTMILPRPLTTVQAQNFSMRWPAGVDA